MSSVQEGGREFMHDFKTCKHFIEASKALKEKNAAYAKAKAQEGSAPRGESPKGGAPPPKSK